jgi:hypothetical protein
VSFYPEPAWPPRSEAALLAERGRSTLHPYEGPTIRGERWGLGIASNSFVPRLEPTLEKLARAQRLLLRSADSIPAEHWKTPPKRGTWCAAEVVAHIIMVERSVIGRADRVLQHMPKEFPFFRRFHLPLALVERRIIRQKTPIPLDPGLVQEKETMLAELREVRERTLAFLEETRGRDLSKYRWPHPFLGSFDMYEWFQFVASHEIRHEKQLREISAGLPKAIATLQK